MAFGRKDRAEEGKIRPGTAGPEQRRLVMAGGGDEKTRPGPAEPSGTGDPGLGKVKPMGVQASGQRRIACDQHDQAARTAGADDIFRKGKGLLVQGHPGFGPFRAQRFGG